MRTFITAKETSKRWDISSHRINLRCKNGRIPGVYKEDKQWMIHADAIKLTDRRLKTGNYVSDVQAKGIKQGEKKLTLPIGISDYRKASFQYYYADKTLLIRDFIDERSQVSLFTHPRRFGKPLSMDMLGTFLKEQKKTICYLTV